MARVTLEVDAHVATVRLELDEDRLDRTALEALAAAGSTIMFEASRQGEA